MKRITQLALAGLLFFGFTSCTKEAAETQPEEVTPDAIAKIKALGFSTQNVQRTDGGYLVEGDINLSEADINSAPPTSPELIIANEEHYRTNYLVSPTKYPTINVRLSSSSSSHATAFSYALNEAIRRYNALGLRIKFRRVTSGAHITVNAYYQVSNTLGSAGFPTSTGAPYSQIQMNTYHYSTSTGSTNINYIATIIAHEMGHCIGFRHTDYMNRSYSCGGTAVNEGSSTVGAIHIPGTPTGPSSGSWMLACIGKGVNRPFTYYDRTALYYVY